MPRMLNAQHETFCRHFVRGPHAGNLVEAYEAAGFARDRGNACRLARAPEIAARINALRDGEAAAERAQVRAALVAQGIDKARIVAELAAIAFANALDFVSTDADGTVRADLKRIEHARGGAIRDIAVDCVAATANKPAVTKVRLKLNDKHKALVELGRQIDAAQEPALPVDEKAPPPSVEQQRENLVTQLRDLADFGENVVDLAERAVEARKQIQRGWIEPTPQRLARLRSAVSEAASGMQQAVSEAVLAKEPELDEAGVEGRAEDCPRHCEERSDEAIQRSDAGHDAGTSQRNESDLDCFVGPDGPPRNDGASPVPEPAVTDAVVPAESSPPMPAPPRQDAFVAVMMGAQ